MKSTFTCLLYHVVFSTRGREPWLRESVLAELVPYVGGIVRNMGGKLLAGGGVEDHLHLLPSLPARVDVPTLVRTVKANSSRWLKERFNVREFQWQTGYAAMSVSRALQEAAEHYIRTQRDRHQRATFEEEIRAIYAACGLDGLP